MGRYVLLEFHSPEGVPGLRGSHVLGTMMVIYGLEYYNMYRKVLASVLYVVQVVHVVHLDCSYMTHNGTTQ